MYCVRDVNLGNRVTGFLTGEQGHRACFRDSDDDGKFDQLWSGDEISPSPNYVSLFIAKNTGANLESPLNYVKLDKSEMPLDTVAINYTTKSPLLASKYIDLYIAAEDSKGKMKAFQSIRTIKTDDIKLPTTVSYNGLEIEILSYDKNSNEIEYRVNSGFEEESPVLLVSKRKPVVVYY